MNELIDSQGKIIPNLRGDIMRSSMERALKEEALAPALRKCEIVPAALGEEIGDYAAIGVAKEYGESIK